MNIRMIINSFLAVSTLGLSQFALALPSLVIHNNTDFYSTVITNNGACSGVMSERKGITPPHDVKIFDPKTVGAACLTNSENCKADAYLTENCKGPVVATVIFSVRTGIKSKTNIPNSGYCLKGEGFDVTLDPNPTNEPCI